MIEVNCCKCGQSLNNSAYYVQRESKSGTITMIGPEWDTYCGDCYELLHTNCYNSLQPFYCPKCRERDSGNIWLVAYLNETKNGLFSIVLKCSNNHSYLGNALDT